MDSAQVHEAVPCNSSPHPNSVNLSDSSQSSKSNTTSQGFLSENCNGIVGKMHSGHGTRAKKIDADQYSSASSSVRPSVSSNQSMHPSPVQRHVSYPETMTMIALTLDFGLPLDEKTVLGMKRVTSQPNALIKVTLNMKHKELQVEFRLHILDSRSEKPGREIPRMRALDREEDFKFLIPFTDLDKIVDSPCGPECSALFITPQVPPKFFKRLHYSRREDHSRTRTTTDAWYRQTDVAYSPNSLKSPPLSLKKTRAVLDLGRWTTYRLVFDRSKNDLCIYRQMYSALRDYNVRIDYCPDLELSSDKGPTIWEHIDRPVEQGGQGRGALHELIHDDQVSHLSFGVRYQLEVCISYGCFNEYSLNRPFVEKLAAMEPQSAQDLLAFIATEKKQVFRPLSIFESGLDVGTTSLGKIPDHCILVRSATVTPTTIRFHTPTIDTSNRVIRHYAEYADHFLRVRFSEEQADSKIFSTNKSTMNEIFTRIKRTLANGIKIGERTYQFLAFGNSQLREHGAYFFASTPHIDVKHIRMWMGSFQDIKEVAKYASRLGLCFSTTRAISGVLPQIEEVQDVEHNGFNFTDGVGRISPFLAQLAASELNILRNDREAPSVFQFRLGGCKGVLAVWPTPEARKLHLRYSQYKFPAIHEGLEIIRWSQYACAKLNRQLILVLSTLGVADRVFEQKLDIQLQDFKEAKTNPEMALRLLNQYVDHNQMTLTLASMVLDGFQNSEEPFVLALLRLWTAWSVKYLKEKAQLAVQSSALLLGCVDETNQLRGHFDEIHRQMPGPGVSIQERSQFLPQIFVQLSRDPSDRGSQKPKVILGPVLLTRSPTLHPGDVRVVCCVDMPELHHVKDAVVLPQNGDRDLASMCSGGDLDGDEFLVIWDRELLPKEWNHEPMSYTPPPPLIHESDITVDDMTTFFVTYIKNDSLGTIANSHLTLADQSDRGVKDEKCLKLARLHSEAVDFPKTGRPAQMTQDLRPRQRPHFLMDKKKHVKQQVYTSRKILGKLYDRVNTTEFATGLSPDFSAPFDRRIVEAYDISSAMLGNARRLKTDYDAAIRRVMAKFDIETELEVWSTFVLAHNWPGDFKFHEVIGQASGALKCQFRDQCIEAAGGKDIDQLGPFVAAMYCVTGQEIAAFNTQIHGQVPPGLQSRSPSQIKTSKMPLTSFPWIFQDILGKIARLNSFSSPSFDNLPASAQPISGNLFQPKAVYNSLRKGNNNANKPVVLPNLETPQGTVHPGEIFKPFASLSIKGTQDLCVEDRLHSNGLGTSALSSSTQGQMKSDEKLHFTVEATFSPAFFPSSEQSDTLNENKNFAAQQLRDPNISEAGEVEGSEIVEAIFIDHGSKRSASEVLETFAYYGADGEEGQNYLDN